MVSACKLLTTTVGGKSGLNKQWRWIYLPFTEALCLLTKPDQSLLAQWLSIGQRDVTQIQNCCVFLIEKCQAVQVRICHHSKVLLPLRVKEGTAPLALFNKKANSANAQRKAEREWGRRKAALHVFSSCNSEEVTSHKKPNNLLSKK